MYPIGNIPPENAPVGEIPFPVPPMYYIKKYTDLAVSNGTAPAPPPVPNSNQICTMFGELYYKDDHIISSLENQGIRRLYPQGTYDSKKELKKLNISVVANFMDLLQIISQEPSSNKRSEKIDHISVIFYNMHHLINEYRPHQARDTLREIMKSQIDSVRKTTEKAHEYSNKANELMSKLNKELTEYFRTQKSVESILTECGLTDLIDVKMEPGQKRKLEEVSDTDVPSCSTVKIKKECIVNHDLARPNFIISDYVKNSSLWNDLLSDNQ